MRRYLTVILVALAALCFAGVATATLVQTASTHLTAHRAGASTGISASMQASDATALGGKPVGVSRLVLAFPEGTRFHLSTPLLQRCRLTDKQLTKTFGPSCSRKSRIGTGTAVANAMPMTAAIKERVDAYVRNAHHVVLVVKPTSPGFGTLTFLFHATVSGPKLTVLVPKIVLGRPEGITAVLVSLKLDVPALGKGKKALITAGRCMAGKFVVTQTFSYADGSRIVIPGSSRCH